MNHVTVMSGRKQHYIPQFIMRGFSESGSGKYAQVKVYRRDNSFSTSTEGVGAEREFYSKLNNDEQTLDDMITNAETEYEEIHRTLLQASVNDTVDSKRVARLLAHLSIRGNNIRDSLSTGGRYAIATATEAFSDSDTCKQLLGLSGSEPSQKLKEKLDNLYNENRAKVRTARMSRHEFRKFAFNHAKQNWDVAFRDFLPSISFGSAVLDFPTFAAEAHNDILQKNIEPEVRVAAMESFAWRIIETDAELILPDCLGLAHDEEEGPTPLAFAGVKDLKGVVFPLTPTKAVCGGIYLADSLLDVLLPKFQTFAAHSSWEFFVAAPKTQIDQSTQRLIGGKIAKTITSSIEEALQDALLEGLKA